MPEAEPGRPSSPRGLDAERLNSLVQTLAIIGAGAWGVYTFIYEARIKPSLEPPAVSSRRAWRRPASATTALRSGPP